MGARKGHIYDSVYHTARWRKLRRYIINRDKDICFFCGQLILTGRTVHHKHELDENNFTDEMIAYNPDNLVECHSTCHNIHHDRFGFNEYAYKKKTIVEDDLEIDYSKRTI